MKLLVAAAFVALVAPLQAIKASRGIHPNLAPLFNVRTDFARTDLDKFKGVAAKLDNVTNQIVVVNEVKVGPSGPSGHAAWAHLADRLNETGWMELHVSTPHEAFFSTDVKMYSAGLLEGLLSAERMSQFYSNFYPLLQPEEDSSRALLNIRNLFNLQVQHVMHQCGLSGGLGEEPEDPYWKQVRYLFLQMWGLKDAYNVVAQEKGVSTIDMVDMFFINSHAELGEMMQAMGWAGYLGSETQYRCSGPNERSLQDAADAAVKLGIGAREIEDANGWELLFFQNTLEDLNGRCPKNSQVVYHYTDLPSAKSIVLGRRGLRVSRGGFKGGGVFFSKKSPVEDVDPAQGDRLWRELFPRWRDQQLVRNYGANVAPGRKNQVDAVLVCYVPFSMLEDVSQRSDAAFISLEKFETFAAEYFAYRNIPRAFRLA